MPTTCWLRCTVCSIKKLSEGVGNCLKRLLLCHPLRLQSLKPPSPPNLRGWGPPVYLFAHIDKAGSYSWSCLSCVLSVWSQDMSSEKENGKENELGHTLIKDWCTVRDKLTLKVKTEQRPWQIQPSSSGMDMGEKSTSEFERTCRRLMEEN